MVFACTKVPVGKQKELLIVSGFFRRLQLAAVVVTAGERRLLGVCWGRLHACRT